MNCREVEIPTHKFEAGDKVKLVNIPANLAGHIYNGTELTLKYKSEIFKCSAWKVEPELIDPETQKPYTDIEEDYMELIK